MSVDMRCQDKDRLIAYLYDEDAGAERDGVEAHLARCATCAAEIEGLRATRGTLSEWRAPDVDLGFTIVRQAPRRRSAWIPAWATLPAAAVLVLAAAAAIAHVEVRYDQSGVTVRSGWNRSPNAAAGIAAAPATPSGDAWRTALAETERRLREEFAATSSSPIASRETAAGARLDAADVRALIEASERRQQRELALRIRDVVQEMEAQRRADLVQIDENLGHIEGLTAARQREVMNYLVRVAEGR